MNEATTFFNSFHQNDRFYGDSRPLKIRLLQHYEVLWIHNIDAICNFRSPSVHVVLAKNLPFHLWRTPCPFTCLTQNLYFVTHAKGPWKIPKVVFTS